MTILKDKVVEVGYPIGDEQYPDESKEILKSIFASSEDLITQGQESDEDEVIEEPDESNGVIIVS